MRNAADVRHIS